MNIARAMQEEGQGEEEYDGDREDAEGEEGRLAQGRDVLVREEEETEDETVVRFASSEGRRRPKQEMLTAHISGLTAALKKANSLLMECQGTLIAEREEHGKQVALLRARGAAHRIVASERATRLAADLSATEAKAAHAEAEAAEARRLLGAAQQALTASQLAQRAAQDEASRAVATQRTAERKAASIQEMLQSREADHARSVMRCEELSRELAAHGRESARAAAGMRDACVGDDSSAAPQLRDVGCQAAAPPPLPTADPVESTVLVAAGPDVSTGGDASGRRRAKKSPPVQSKSMNRQHRLVRSRLKAVCAAAAAADVDHQRTVVQLRDTQRQLLALHKQLQDQAADQSGAESKVTMNPSNREELLRLRSSCRALGTEFAQMSAAVRGQLMAVSPQMAEMALTVQEAMRRASSSEALRQVRALLTEEQELKAIAVARYRKEMLQRKAMYNHLMELKGNIRVFCRVRPLLSTEGSNDLSDGSSGLMQLPPSLADSQRNGNGPNDAGLPLGGLVRFGDDGEIELRNSSDGRRHNFEFDSVFQPHHGQSDVFGDIEPLLVSLVDGYDLCIFAYGQTGSGKTYTMEGASHVTNTAQTGANADTIATAASCEIDSEGVYGRTMHSVFDLMADRADDHEYVVSLSMLEIYNETICDLLCHNDGGGANTSSPPATRQRNTIRIRDRGNGTNDVGDLSAVEVHSAEETMEWVARGRRNRATACTNLNEHSSRSHCVLSLHVRAINKHESLQGSGSAAVTESRLRLIDLAGSERVFRSEATGQRLEETKAINKSLSALGDVIAALKQKQAHIPYRNSKLTHYLQDSLSKKACKTLMLAQVSPAADDHDESLCTLTFAQRVRATELSPVSKKQKGAKAKAKAAAAAASAAFYISSQASAAARTHSTSTSTGNRNTCDDPADSPSLGGNGDSRQMQTAGKCMPNSSSPGGEALSSMEEGNAKPRSTSSGYQDPMSDQPGRTQQGQHEERPQAHHLDHLLTDNSVATESQSRHGRAGASGGSNSSTGAPTVTIFVDPPDTLSAKPKQKQTASRSPASSLYAKVAALEAADKENPDTYQLHKLAKRGAVAKGVSEGTPHCHCHPLSLPGC